MYVRTILVIPPVFGQSLEPGEKNKPRSQCPSPTLSTTDCFQVNVILVLFTAPPNHTPVQELVPGISTGRVLTQRS